MMFIGPDFRAGLREALYRPVNPVGLRQAIAIFAFLVFVNQIVLQGLFGIGFAVVGASDLTSIQANALRGALLALLPAGLLTALLAWLLARRRGVDPRAVLALNSPALGVVGWLAIAIGFFAALFGISIPLARLFGPENTGLVEQAVARLANDPFYILIAAGIVIGGPLAEEFMFRGQIFAALSQTRLGYLGTAVVTSALWAALHVTEPLHFIGVIFVMGLVLSWLLVRFGSLWVPIVCHCAWNMVSTVILYGLSPQ